MLKEIESIAVIVGVLFLAVQIGIQTKTARDTLKRKRKQSTIEFYNSMFIEREPFYDFFRNSGKKVPLNLQFVRKNSKLKESIPRYLSRLERLSVGINSKIYDFDTIYDIAANHIKRSYKLLEGYIKELRRVEGSETYYCNLEIIVKKIEKRMAKKKSIGNLEKWVSGLLPKLCKPLNQG